MRTNPHFVFLLPNFIDALGHQLHFNLGISKALSILELSYEAYIGKDSRLLLSPQWKKHFCKNQRRNLRSVGRRFIDFYKVFRLKQKARHIFFIENFTTSDLVCFALAALFFVRRRNGIWLFLHGEFSLARLSALARKICFSLLDRKFKDNFKKLTSTEHLQHWFKNYRVATHLMPMPVEISLLEKNGKTHNTSFTCLWPGEVRAEKKPEIFEKLLLSEEASTSLFSFILPEKMHIPPNKQATTFKRGISQEEYLRWFEMADFVLLTYESRPYKYKISYVFIESVLMGKMPIVTKETWMADDLAKHGLEELVVDWQRPDFFTHLSFLGTDIFIQTRLREMQKSYLNKYSPQACAQFLKTLM